MGFGVWTWFSPPLCAIASLRQIPRNRRRTETNRMERNFAGRTLFHADNLPILRGMNSETVYLIAADPPFNKGRDKARFRRKDPDGRLWSDCDISAKGLSGGGYEYEYKGIRSLRRVSLDTMKRLDAEGRQRFAKSGGIRRKRCLDEMKGRPAQALWDDINAINSRARRLPHAEADCPLRAHYPSVIEPRRHGYRPVPRLRRDADSRRASRTPMGRNRHQDFQDSASPIPRFSP